MRTLEQIFEEQKEKALVRLIEIIGTLKNDTILTTKCFPEAYNEEHFNSLNSEYINQLEDVKKYVEQLTHSLIVCSAESAEIELDDYDEDDLEEYIKYEIENEIFIRS
jgi:hypothetical protein